MGFPAAAPCTLRVWLSLVVVAANVVGEAGQLFDSGVPEDVLGAADVFLDSAQSVGLDLPTRSAAVSMVSYLLLILRSSLPLLRLPSPPGRASCSVSCPVSAV